MCIQVTTLQQALPGVLGDLPNLRVEAKTIDSVQGQERDFVLLSMVRSFEPGTNANMGFLDNPNRMNVSHTRGKQVFWIIGNATSLTTTDPNVGGTPEYNWCRLHLEWCRRNGYIFPVSTLGDFPIQNVQHWGPADDEPLCIDLPYFPLAYGDQRISRSNISQFSNRSGGGGVHNRLHNSCTAWKVLPVGQREGKEQKTVLNQAGKGELYRVRPAVRAQSGKFLWPNECEDVSGEVLGEVKAQVEAAIEKFAKELGLRVVSNGKDVGWHYDQVVPVLVVMLEGDASDTAAPQPSGTVHGATDSWMLAMQGLVLKDKDGAEWGCVVRFTQLHYAGVSESIRLPRLRLSIANLHPIVTADELIMYTHDALNYVYSLPDYADAITQAYVGTDRTSGLSTRYGWVDFTNPKAAPCFYREWKNTRNRTYPFDGVVMSVDCCLDGVGDDGAGDDGAGDDGAGDDGAGNDDGAEEEDSAEDSEEEDGGWEDEELHAHLGTQDSFAFGKRAL